MKKACFKWYEEGKPDNDHPLLIVKKKCKQQFRKTYRIELAMKEINFKSKIMQTRTKNSKTFHMLINKQRRSLRGCIQDLHIDNKTMSGKENILQGFNNHFANLSVPSYYQSYNSQYSTNIELETDNIIELVNSVDIFRPLSLLYLKTRNPYILHIKNYRGITVLPVFEKIVESILKNRVTPKCYKRQCSIHRGFTQNSVPIHSSFILEESR